METGFRRAAAALLASACSTAAVFAFNPFYKLAVVAETNGSTLTYIDPDISINDKGQVAFIGGFPGTGKDNLQRHIYVAKEWGPVVDISPGIGPITYDIGPSCQINNNTQVLAQREDHLSFGVVSYRLEVWDGNTTNAPTLRTCGEVLNTSCPDFDGIFRYASLNNNSYAGVVFSAIAADGSTRQLATDTSDGKFKGGLGTLEVPRPMTADNRFFVIRRGTTQISYYSPKFASRLDVAATASAGGVFSDNSLGMRPGVSDDGRVVVFYGDLLSAGANAWNTSPGLGVFAALIDTSASPPTVQARMRVAGLTKREDVGTGGGNGDGIWQFGEPFVDAAELGWDFDGTNAQPISLSAWESDSRVSVTNQVEDSFVVAFIATPSRASRINPQTSKPLLFTDQRGVWSVRVDAKRARSSASPSGTGPISYFSTSPLPIVQMGDLIVSGVTVTDLQAPYDGLAIAATDDTRAFIRCRRPTIERSH